MHARELTLDLDPWSLFRALASKERPFFIDAGQSWGEEWVSSMGFRPRMQFRVTAADAPDAPFARLDDLLATMTPAPRDRTRVRPVPFAGGIVTAIAYEARHAVEHSTPVAGEAADAPRLVAALYDAALSYDHRTHRWWLASWHLDARALAILTEEIRDAAADAARGAHPTALPLQTSTVTTSLDPDAYAARVARIHDYIAAGDVYQVNLTRRLSAPLPDAADVAALGAALAEGNPAPYSAVVRLPDHGVHIASASPELFLRRDGDLVTSAPIKGTASAPDGFLPKDRAENVMIVDLVRNDFGRVCEYGSVTVPALWSVEVHPGLCHLVSTVQGRLRAGVGWGDVIAATFPPGSVTGAPKIAAVDLLRRLEPVPRDVYCGAIGWVDADRCIGELNVAIRTFWFDDGRLHFGTGGAITWDSTPDGEWEETELKARRLLRVANGQPVGAAS